MLYVRPSNKRFIIPIQKGVFFKIVIIIINNNYNTFTIRTNNTYNTLEYKQKEREKKNTVTFTTKTCEKVALFPTKYKEKQYTAALSYKLLVNQRFPFIVVALI